MLRISELKLPLDHAPEALAALIARTLEVPPEAIASHTVYKRSFDARKAELLTVYICDVALADAKREAVLLAQHAGHPHIQPAPDMRHTLPADVPAGASRPVVIGFGPCGIFAALMLAQMGLRPIVLERGKTVRQRTKDTWGLWRKSVLNPESNVQIVALGGEIRFEQRVTDVRIEDGHDGKHLRGLTVLDQATGQSHALRADHVVMALGHSSRDTFAMLHERGVHIEAKPFSIGFRVEHPQGLIDRARWGRHAGHPMLGAADYKLVHHASNGRSVYSFCMCPGGTVVAATSEPGRVVTNGMSQYSRAERNANAGIVVGIDPRDYPEGPLAGIALQRALESNAFVLGGGDYRAPGQLVGDFIAGKPSTQLGEVMPSYKPGVTPTDLHRALPDFAIEAMREAFPAFGRKIKGFDLHDAVLTGVETRTSSPIRITRGEDFQSLNVRGLYPAGEGASYAGGILSAGVDGIKVAEAVARGLRAEAERQRTAAV